LLGLRRDLLTAAAYGVDRFLFVHGDKPTAGGRTSELTVRAMIEEARGVAGDPAFAGCRPFGVGVTSGLRLVPGWKAAADFVLVQVSFSVDALLRWRESAGVQVPVYAGVMVLASAGMARSLAAAIPDIEIPASWLVMWSVTGMRGWTRRASRSWPSATVAPSTVCIWCR
jgi:methylenetetrahydrofolate reductase (NADPH)